MLLDLWVRWSFEHCIARYVATALASALASALVFNAIWGVYLLAKHWYVSHNSGGAARLGGVVIPREV